MAETQAGEEQEDECKFLFSKIVLELIKNVLSLARGMQRRRGPGMMVRGKSI